MSVLAWILAVLVVVVWAFTAVDAFRRHYSSAGRTAAWLVLIVVLPFVGSLVCWLLHKLAPDDVESQGLAEADLWHSASARLFDSARTGV
jgi:H+/Cl- antiporter ClcA